jgi:hypothetical protein
LVGAIFCYYREQVNPRSDFAILDGTYNNNSNSFVYLDKIVNNTSNANSGTTTTGQYNPSYWFGCIASFIASGTGSTITVTYDGRYAGSGSKQTTVYYSGATTIMQVASNVPSHLENSALIENLVIDGKGQANTVGIFLENVYNCCVRNVTIMNCDVGIKVSVTGSNWSQANRFEHIRMINVKTGIQFTGNSSGKDFSYTTIDDVGISVTLNSDSVGIKIDSNTNLYSSFIKATVWLDTSAATGMLVNGELKLSIVNFEVESNPSYAGKGLTIISGAYVCDNQSFLLTTGGIQENNRKTGSGTTDNTLMVRYL